MNNLPPGATLIDIDRYLGRYYAEGWTAAEAGEEKDACPYPDGRGCDWENGWAAFWEEWRKR